MLTGLLCMLCVLCSWTIEKAVKAYFALFLMLECSVMGVFMSLDFFLFYVFWEVMLIPMFFLIGVWGGENREYAAIKFFLYTFAGSVLMLVAIISIYWITGTTDVVQLYEIGIDQKYQNLLWLAFFSSFAVKTPMWPVHTWLPDAHVEAPTA